MQIRENRAKMRIFYPQVCNTKGFFERVCVIKYNCINI